MKFIYTHDVTLPEHLTGKRGDIVDVEPERVVDLVRSGHVVPGETLPAEMPPNPEPAAKRLAPKDLTDADPLAVAATGDVVVKREENE